MAIKDLDPKGLIFESFRIDGITEGECRSIFLDWAIGMPMGQVTPDLVSQVLDHYAPLHPGHPMIGVLEEGAKPKPAARRRGGRRARVE